MDGKNPNEWRTWGGVQLSRAGNTLLTIGAVAGLIWATGEPALRGYILEAVATETKKLVASNETLTKHIIRLDKSLGEEKVRRQGSDARLDRLSIQLDRLLERRSIGIPRRFRNEQ